jgi:hypothetical protein
MRDFLETIPPGAEKIVADLRVRDKQGVGYHLNTPDIHLHCDSKSCGGIRIYECKSYIGLNQQNISDFLDYVCRNCKRTFKRYSIQIAMAGDNSRITKYGELPAFGPPTPARALSLIGPDRDLFLKGRRCELQGLGIGAFTYYRRVIEDQRNRIFDEIIRVLETTDPDNAVIAEVKAARNEQQFTKSIEAIKHALPSSLLVNGQNPLRLLHSALSEGVHTLTDQECLDLATAARTVLFEFSERLAQALRDDAELSRAVALLNKAKTVAK